jgi:hypothetical protein
MVRGQCGQKLETLSEKQTKSKRNGGVAQVAEHLPSEHKVLSLISSTKKKNPGGQR